MKLKRHQKENGWVSERYTSNGYIHVPTDPHPQVSALDLFCTVQRSPVCAYSAFLLVDGRPYWGIEWLIHNGGTSKVGAMP